MINIKIVNLHPKYSFFWQDVINIYELMNLSFEWLK